MGLKASLSVATAIVAVAIYPAVAQTPLNQQNFREFQQLLSPSSGLQSPVSIAQPICLDAAGLSMLTPIQLNLKDPTKRELPCNPATAASKGLGDLILWNQIALDTTAIDHAPPQPGDNSRSALQHPGPHRSARAMAIVHIAMFDAVNDISRFNQAGQPFYRYESYLPRLSPIDKEADIPSAIAASAFVTLCTLYSAQAVALRLLYEKSGGVLEEPSAGLSVPTTPCAIKLNTADPKGLGAKAGLEAARRILDKRTADRSEIPEPQVGDDGFMLDDTPGKWRPDPVSGQTVALGGRWGEVETFSGFKQKRFRPPAPPPLTDAVYTRDFNEVKRLGGLYNTERRGFETFIGRFWAYDGTAFLCAPPRLYNQIARTLVLDPTVPAKASEVGERGEVKKKNLDNVVDVARLFALLNTAMADAAISAWEAKYAYKFWRPVTGIRAAALDGNPLTIPDPTWVPLGAPASNSDQMPNFTPPFPAYPSGHAVFGGAVFEVLRHFFPEETAFVFTSDEYNGSNIGFGESAPRHRLPQSFVSLSHPEYMNARSRIYLGVHWQFDADVGIAQGNQVGSFVFANRMQCQTSTGVLEGCNLKTGLPKSVMFEPAATASEQGVAPDPRPAATLSKTQIPFSAPAIGSTTLPSGVVVQPSR